MARKIYGKRPVYWEYKDEESNKFWAAHIIKESKPDNRPTTASISSPSALDSSGQSQFRLVRKWGKIGTKGQSMEQIFDSIYEAEQALDKLIWEKEAKGYKPKF